MARHRINASVFDQHLEPPVGDETTISTVKERTSAKQPPEIVIDAEQDADYFKFATALSRNSPLEATGITVIGITQEGQ